ncbi:Uncharacterised protein [Mycobacteroides abscessus subsp. abscessus]|nr:Uncharacterised protein [Mycobacteroides abscessus subsp. abscessus]
MALPTDWANQGTKGSAPAGAARSTVARASSAAQGSVRRRNTVPSWPMLFSNPSRLGNGFTTDSAADRSVYFGHGR